MAAGNTGLDHHFVAGLCPGDEFTGFAHHSRDVVAENVRQRYFDARQSTAGEDIEMIQCAGFDFDENLIRADLRVGNIGVLQHLRPAMLSKYRRLHEDCSVTSLSAACSRAW